MNHLVEDDMTQELKGLLEQWSTAELQSDNEAIDYILVDDFVGVGPRGFTLTKDAWLQRYTTGGLVNEAFALDETQVRVYDNTAIVIGRLTQQATYQGHNASGQFRATLVWVWRQDRWWFASLHLSPTFGPA